ncbi:MAG: 30S ribosomal protein S4e [Halobacteriaceae archaeon]
MGDHQKRLSAPTEWPVERKTETFTAKAGAGPHGEDGVPLVIVLRDVLGYVDSAAEAQYATNTGGVLVNGQSVGDINRPIGMFDILAFPDRGEYYRVFPDEGGRLGLTPIDADAAGSKLSKIVDKTTVSGGEVQLNLHDGTNLLADDGYAAGDSVVVSNDDKSIVAHFEYEEGALVTAVDGEHAGEIGHIEEIDVTRSSAPNNVRVETDDGPFETIEEYVVVIDEQFVEGDADDDADETGGDIESDESESESDEYEPESGVNDDEAEATDGAETETAEGDG